MAIDMIFYYIIITASLYSFSKRNNKRRVTFLWNLFSARITGIATVTQRAESRLGHIQYVCEATKLLRGCQDST